MKSSRILGRVLGICLPALLVVATVVPSRALVPQQVSPMPRSSVSIRHLEGARYRLSLSTRAVQDVRSVIEPGLAGLFDEARATSTLRDALDVAYGSRMSESSVPMGYTLWWDGTRWVVICTTVSSFEIDFGSLGTVVVESRDVLRVP